MAKFHAYAYITGEIYIGEVEAESYDEAIKIANERYRNGDLEGRLDDYQLDDIMIEDGDEEELD